MNDLPPAGTALPPTPALLSPRWPLAEPQQAPAQGSQLPPAAAPAAALEDSTSPVPVGPVGLTGTSIEKVEKAIEVFAASKGAAVAVAIRPLISLCNFPSDPAVMDQLLVEMAQGLLSLRSDGARAARVFEETVL